MSLTDIGMRSFEDVLYQTGWGIYNKYALFFSLLCAFCCSVSLTAITFALPVALCDIRLTKNDVIWIHAALPLGMGVGVLSMGFLSDIVSRKFILSCSLLQIFLSSFACGFCCEFSMFLIFTFMLGVSTSANFAYTKVNLSEILPTKHRGYYLILLDIFWVLGYIISSCINWALRCRVPIEYSDHYTSWRMLFTFGSVVSIFGICLHGILQPSPRMLLATSRKLEAYLVLKYIFSLNNSDHSDNYKVLSNELELLVHDIEVDREYDNSCKDQCILSKFKLWKILGKLFQFKTLIVLCMITIVRLCLFTGYGMANIWLIKSLHMNTTNCYLSSQHFLYLNNENTMFTDCDYFIPTTVFRDYILIASSGFVGLILFSYIVDRFGRHIPLSISLICCGVASTNFIFIREYTYRYILAVIYMTGFAISNAALDIIVIENIPTCIRSSGLGITLFLPNIEAFVFHIFLVTECTVYYYFIGAFSISVGILGYFLPDRKRRPMQE